jgi:hypothetical protein
MCAKIAKLQISYVIKSFYVFHFQKEVLDMFLVEHTAHKFTRTTKTKTLIYVYYFLHNNN